MNKSEEKARNMIAALTTEKIVEQFELTDEIEDENISIVRGWLMDELEKRNPEAFEKWIDAYTESPREYFI